MALKAVVLYNFQAEPGNNELSVREGETVTVIDQAVGGGWIAAQNSSGQSGLVPEGYLLVSMLGLLCAAPAGQKGMNKHKNIKCFSDWQKRFSNVNMSPGAAEDDNSEWDDDWDDQSVSSYHGNGHTEEEGGTSGRIAHGPSVKISMNKFPFSKGPNPEVFLLAKPLANSRDRLPVYQGEVGPVWLYPTTPLDCIIADPKKESKLYGLKSFIEYQITPNTTNRHVTHRYKHFDWLYERLLEKFGSLLPIPSLPDKQVTGRFDEDFIRMRMERLQAWMTRMCRHPVVSQSEVFQLFLTYKDEREWKAGKRKAEKDELVGPMMFSLIEPEAPELDVVQVEQKCEQFSRFTRSMDDGVRELLNVGHTHWKRCTGPLPKEYERIGRAIRNLSTPQKDLYFLLETNSEYKGLLGCFPEIITVHKAAVDKMKEADRLISAGKISSSDRKCMNQRVSCMSYSLQAEMNHFHSNRIYDYNRVMQCYLEQQVTFYQQIADKLREALSRFTTL
uniref:Sorting nexin 9 n=1 Tax=Nothobranchius furzeri TaxID=105023 RepID=A0A8C6LSX7_NOTFU